MVSEDSEGFDLRDDSPTDKNEPGPGPGVTVGDSQVLTTLSYAMGSKAVLANGFQLLKVEGHLRVSFGEAVHPAIPLQPRGAALLPDQVAKDLALNILEYYRRSEELQAAAMQPSGGVN